MQKILGMLLAITFVITFTGTSSSVQAQAIDSVRIDSISVLGLNAMNSARVHVHYYGVTPSGTYRVNYGVNVNDTSTLPRSVAGGTDTSSMVLTGLNPSTTYQCKAQFFLPIVKDSPIKTFTTSACSFTASFTDIEVSDCKHHLDALQVAGASYVWKINGTVFATTQSVDVNTSGNYSVTISSGGCSSSYSKYVTVPGLTITITATATSVCPDDTVILYGNGATTYSWNLNPGTKTGDSIILTPTTTINVTLTGTCNGCTATTTTTITVKSKPQNVTLTSDEDSLCNNSVHPIKLKGGNSSGANGAYYGQWVTQDYFLPDTTFLGASEVTYVATGSNGCTASAKKVFHVIGSPDVKKMYFIGRTFAVEGWFPYPIELKIGGMVHLTSEQNSSQALFDNISLNEGDGVIVKSIIGGCFVLLPFHYPLGIMEEQSSIIKEGEKIDVYSLMGVIIKTISSPREFQTRDMYQVAGLFDLPTGVYIWRSKNITKKFVSRQ